MKKKDRENQGKWAEDARDRGDISPRTARELGAKPVKRTPVSDRKRKNDAKKVSYISMTENMCVSDISGKYIGPARWVGGDWNQDVEDELLRMIDGQKPSPSDESEGLIILREWWMAKTVVDGNTGTTLQFKLKIEPEYRVVRHDFPLYATFFKDNPTLFGKKVAIPPPEEDPPMTVFEAELVSPQMRALYEIFKLLDEPALFLFDRWLYGEWMGHDVNYREVMEEFNEVFGPFGRTYAGKGVVHQALLGRKDREGTGIVQDVKNILDRGHTMLEKVRKLRKTNPARGMSSDMPGFSLMNSTKNYSQPPCLGITAPYLSRERLEKEWKAIEGMRQKLRRSR